MPDYKILHIANDDKFIANAMWLFNKTFPTHNKFLFILPDSKHSLKFINQDKDFIFYYKDRLDYNEIINVINQYDLIVLHYLDFVKCNIVLRANTQTNFLWLFYGAEVYENPQFGNEFISKETFKCFRKSIFIRSLKNIFRPFKYRFMKNSPDRFKMVEKAAKKINNFGILYKEEYEFMVNHNILSQDSNFVKTTYYPLEIIFEDFENNQVDGKNILVGNSASITNNHVDVFNKLSEFDLGNKKVIVPLSYGDYSYQKRISLIGHEKLSVHFTPLIEFMPLHDYNKIIRQCNIVIMNHYRQQAVGNVLAMIWLGAKLYLSKKNTLFQYLSRIGIIVFSIEKDLNIENEDALAPLNKSEINQNRSILKEEIGISFLVNRLKTDLENVIHEH